MNVIILLTGLVTVHVFARFKIVMLGFQHETDERDLGAFAYGQAAATVHDFQSSQD